MLKFLIGMIFTFFTLYVHAEVRGQDYSLGPGDVVKITVYGSPDLTTQTRVTANGTISFPLIGDLLVNGASPNAAEKKIAELLEKGGFVKQPQVSLLVQQFGSQYVTVVGDVNKPDRYPLDKVSNLVDVLALAGGVSPNGSDIVSVVTYIGKKAVKKDYDLRDLLNKGDVSQNPIVKAGDLISVHAREVSVLGQVNRPGKYSLQTSVRTVGDFLSIAGGITEIGSDSIVVTQIRGGNVKKQVINVDQAYRNADAQMNTELQEGDVIYVPRQPVFYIYGEVNRPGQFRLELNQTVAQAISIGGGITQRGTERRIVIRRNNGNGSAKDQTISASLNDVLQENDVVYVNEGLF